jgi:hypothetical protein
MASKGGCDLPESIFRSLKLLRLLKCESQALAFIKSTKARNWLIARQLLIYVKPRRVARQTGAPAVGHRRTSHSILTDVMTWISKAPS